MSDQLKDPLTETKPPQSRWMRALRKPWIALLGGYFGGNLVFGVWRAFNHDPVDRRDPWTEQLDHYVFTGVMGLIYGAGCAAAGPKILYDTLMGHSNNNSSNQKE